MTMIIVRIKQLLFRIYGLIDIFGPFLQMACMMVYEPKIILDAGCGEGLSIKVLKKFAKSKLTNAYKLGIDIYLPYLKKARETYDDVILADLRFIPLREHSVDIVFCIEVIEHLNKAEGRMLLVELEKIALKQVFLTTPNYFLPQNAINGNPFQIHKSYWKSEEFKKYGYRVFGTTGFNMPLLLKTSLVAKIWNLIIKIFAAPIVKSHPKIAGGLLCVKQLTKKK